jgi:chromosome partitioning protein
MKVLLIDIDPQGHVALGLGLQKSDCTYKLFRTNIPVKDLVINARERLDVIVSNKKTGLARDEIIGKELILKERIKEIDGNYDYVIIDCSPSDNILNTNALVAAEEIIIPMDLAYFSADGLIDLEDTIASIQKDISLIKGVIPMKYDTRKKMTLDVLDYIKEKFKDKISPPIRVNTDIEKSQMYGKTIFEYNSTSNGAQDYLELVKWVIGIE